MEPTREAVIAEKYRMVALLDNATTEEEFNIVNDAISRIDLWLMFH